MRKLLALILVCLVMASSVSAQTIPDQRPSKGNAHTRGLNIATYLRNGVNVQTFGAIADGVTDNTAAFNAALATGFPVYIPESINCFAVNNLTVPSNSVIFGDSGPLYSATGTQRSCITGTAAASIILDPNGNSNMVIENVDIIGSLTGSTSLAITCIEGGSTNMTVINASVRYCGANGLGDFSHQTATLQSIGVYYYGNGQQANSAGLVNLVDSHVVAGFITANYDGIVFPSGSNDNDIDGAKIEYNIDFGEYFQNNAQHNVVRGGLCDHNTNGCAKLGSAQYTSIIGQIWKRNGGTNSGDANCDIFFNGGSTDTVISGVNTTVGVEDNGSGAQRPLYVATFNAGTDVNVSISGSDFTGSTTGPFFFNSTVPKNLTVSNTVGAYPNRIIGEYDLTGELNITPLATPASPTVTTFGTAGSATWTYKVVALTSSGYFTAASTGNANTAFGNATLTTSNYNIITITPVHGASYYQVYRTAVGTSPTTTGLIATVYLSEYSGSIVLKDTGLAGDSSTAPTTNATGILNVGSSGTPTCGTGCASLRTGATDYRGYMVTGSAVTSSTLNFSTTLPYTPVCVIGDSSTLGVAGISSLSSSAMTVSFGTALTGATVYWICTP